MMAASRPRVSMAAIRGRLPRDVAIPATAAGNSHGVDDDAGEVGSVLFGAGRRW